MKKLMIMLLMVVATSTASFAKGSNDNVQTAAKEVVQTMKNAPSGTTYGGGGSDQEPYRGEHPSRPLQHQQE